MSDYGHKQSNTFQTINTITKLSVWNTHTHTRLMALFRDYPGEPVRKAKPIWILLKQETVSGSGIIWAMCKSAPCSRQITTPAPNCSVCLQAGCPSCRPTNSVTALKANNGLKCQVYSKFSTTNIPVHSRSWESYCCFTGPCTSFRAA